MIIMAIDHVRDFISRAAMSFPPENLARTTPALFLTRWITHFCAPVFMFSAGLGAYLWMQRHGKASVARFLLTRGLGLIFLEVTVMRVSYNFSFSLQYPWILVVLWALGESMIVLAGLCWIPVRWLAVISIAVIALHNTLDKIRPAQLGSWAWLWNVLHQPGAIPAGGNVVLIAYPLVPWFAVMAAGFCFGAVMLRAPEERQRILVRTGAALTAGFLVLRALNVYGDPSRWSTARFPVLSFLNCTKYPPSLLFLLMTLGPALLCLAWFDRLQWKVTNPLIVFGRVPLFYFVVHFYAAHAIAVAMAAFRYGRLSFLFGPMPNLGGDKKLFPPDLGYDLWVVYVVWFCLVVALYPLCRWFASVKARRRDWWLSYL